MKNKLVRMCMLCSMAIIFMSNVTLAQQKERSVLRTRKLTWDMLKSPDYKLSASKVQKQYRDKWCKIKTEYDTAPDWIDDLNFRYYVLLRGGPKNEYTLLTGQVNNVNIKHGRGHLSVVYLHPNTVLRWGKVERVAVLINHKGKLVGRETMPSSKSRWWEKFAPVEGYVLNRMQTPFAVLESGSYEAIRQLPAR